MVVNCCLNNCARKGKRRAKCLLEKYPALTLHLSSYSLEPRMCEVHFSYIKERLELNSNNLTKEKCESVEYLDEFFDNILSDCDRRSSQSQNEKCHDPIDPIEQPQNCFDLLWKFLLFVSFCLMFIYNMTKIGNITDTCNKIVQEKNIQITKLKKENNLLKLSAKSQVIKYEKHAIHFRKQLLSIFNDDQIDVLFTNKTRPRQWSEETILKSLKMKFACKSGGYNHLLRENFPFPSERTLRSRMEGLDWTPGILNDVFLFLKEKAKSFNECERECQLVVDEMTIIEGKQYDIASKSHIGLITLPLAKSKDAALATHVLVFMIVGLSSRYKQIVGYHLTGNSISTSHFRDVIVEIVKKAWSIGLKCNGFTSDMGGSNASLWKLWGIKATRKGENVINSISHPCDPLRRFYIVGDVPHLLKRVAQGILNNRTIVFDNLIVKKYKLSHNTVKSSDLFELFNTQKDDQLKLAPKLKTHILNPNNFQKMNVPVSTNLLGANVSRSLHFLYEQLPQSLQKDSTYETTAWFCQVLTRWFKLMSSRHIALSFSKSSYEDISEDLDAVMEIMRHAKFGTDGKWKPFQRGMLVTTTSMLEMTGFLLKELKFEYVLPGRFSQDCVENLFCQIRSGNSKPNALQVVHALKNLSICEYLSPPVRNSSYHFDDSKYLSDFLNIVREAKEEHQEEKEQLFRMDSIALSAEMKSESADIRKVILNRREQNVLYKIACYILYKVTISKKKLHCGDCLSKCLRKEVDRNKPYSMLMSQPNLQYNCTLNVIYINNQLYKYFLVVEKLFRVMHPILSEKNKCNLHRLITTKILDLGFDSDIPNCHSLLKTLTNRFVSFRLKNSGIERNRKRKFDFSSHSIN